jgi:tetratricopeptide (TPR) repeat protein
LAASQPDLAAFGDALIQEIQLPSATSAQNAAPTPAPAAAGIQNLDELVLDLDLALGDDFAIGSASAHASPSSLPTEAHAAASAAREFLFDQGAPVSGIPAKMPPQAAPVNLPGGDSSMLNDLFEEFKEQVGDHAASEDPETHYSLALAFKDMGLLEEAIGEFQNVCQAIERGQPFPHVIQTYTWLAHCLVEKGVPEAAYKWYEQALQAAPDEQTRTAIHYELALAYEEAGQKSEALKHYMMVYSSDINFRGVAERIKTIKS